MTAGVEVIKLNPARQETWRYSAQVLRRTEKSVLVEALFNREDTPFHGIQLKRGDRFVEVYYTDRWYNIMQIHDRDDHTLKGWYCNVTLPAEVSGTEIYYVDLALDLLVYPDGRHLVLDEDEFAELSIDESTRQQARAALEALQTLFLPPVTLRLEDA
jgi:protein associated with RNAse G/E